MTELPPKVVVLAGPNGAGKTTASLDLLLGPLKVDEFVNADAIAKGLSAFAPERVALTAGRVMLDRLDELASRRASFAFETTLATRSFAPRLAELKGKGYEFHLVFVWLPNADMAVTRVAERVRSGGHHVPEETIRRRYVAGMVNLRTLYIPLADSWRVIDSTRRNEPNVIASKMANRPMKIYSAAKWASIMEVEK